MEAVYEDRSVQGNRELTKSAFRNRFRATRAYRILSPVAVYQPGRLERLEEACWRFRCAAARKELKSPAARRAFTSLLRLKRILGDPGWLAEPVSDALNRLQGELEFLVSRRRRGRPKDSLGKAFRRTMRVFLQSPVILPECGCRSLSQSEIDELLNELFMVALGRALSLDSYVRMRKRDKAADNGGISSSHRRRADIALGR